MSLKFYIFGLDTKYHWDSSICNFKICKTMYYLIYLYLTLEHIYQKSKKIIIASIINDSNNLCMYNEMIPSNCKWVWVHSSPHSKSQRKNKQIERPFVFIVILVSFYKFKQISRNILKIKLFKSIDCISLLTYWLFSWKRFFNFETFNNMGLKLILITVNFGCSLVYFFLFFISNNCIFK